MSVIIVTGCSTGIGLETALQLARAGHRVYAGVRSPETATELNSRLAEEDLPVTVLALDITSQHSVDQAVANVLGAEGRIDVLVNNAGIGGGRSVEETPIDEVRALFETNYFGQARMIQAVTPTLRAQRAGRIINVGSSAGRIVLGCHAHYSATKWAMECLSEALALELAEFNVRVSVIEPGVVITPMWGKGELPSEDSPYANTAQRMMRIFEFGFTRPAMPADVAAVIQEAIESEEPRFRYPVGKDAVEMIEARGRVGDEEWIRSNRLQGEEFRQRWEEMLGVDYFPGETPGT